MSADFAVTYSSVHSEARSWSILSEDPYEEAAQPLLATPRPGCEVGESSAVAAARWPRPTMAHGVDYSYVETRLQDTKRRMMAALELVNLRVSYQVDVCTRESLKFCTRHHDAQKDRAAVRTEIERQAANDLAVQHIMRTQALEAGARDYTLEDTGSSS
nr:hypothetical protein [Tanacetum cinerariifolium]